uniref:Transmembrane protein 214 n=1 Tax=Anas platyrhynchos platyrhynchos TaxID=8840 RepID=A0A493T303_ANAPP
MPWVRGLGLCQDQGWCPEPPQPCPARAPRGLRPQRCSGAAARPCCRAGQEVQPFLLVLLRKHCKGSPQNHVPRVLRQRVCGWGSPAVRGVLREAESPPPATGTGQGLRQLRLHHAREPPPPLPVAAAGRGKAILARAALPVRREPAQWGEDGGGWMELPARHGWHPPQRSPTPCRMHPNLTKGFGMIGPKDFFPLLDFAFMPNNSLSPSLQEQLRRLYPRLKVLALGARPEATLHTYFPSFLSRATPSCPPAMRKELLASMSQCLSLDPLSFSVWRQLYTKHLSQSSLLLNHLLESWDNGSRKVRQSLQETVRSFKVTNEELAARGPGSEQDVAACDAACKVLLQKMKGGGFPWSRLLLIGLVFAVGFLLHDVRTHGSLQASTSARVLRSSGILSASQQAWHKASHYALQGYREPFLLGKRSPGAPGSAFQLSS